MSRLAEHREDLIDEIQDNLSMIASGAPVEELGEIFERTSDLFQALGSCNLLMSLDTDGFRRNLVLSGYTRRCFLRQIGRGGTNECRACSRSEAFFDVLVARHDGLARELAQLSPSEWVPDGEYEDDYCYQAFVQQYALEPAGADRGALYPLLDRFEQVLEGAPSPRLDVCRSLLDLDEAAFHDSFERFLSEHEMWIEEQEPYRIHDPVYHVRCLLSVEGLALLHLAERAGYTVQPEYAYCPGIARLPSGSAFPKDLYDEVLAIARAERAQREAERNADDL